MGTGGVHGRDFAELDLFPVLSSPQRARKWASEVLLQWDVTALLDDVQSLVSELVTNAVLHARTRLVLQLALQDAQLRVAVCDESPVMPRTDFDGQSIYATGRGLMLVDELADEWGVESVGGGKSVWCVVRLDRAEAAR